MITRIKLSCLVKTGKRTYRNEESGVMIYKGLE